MGRFTRSEKQSPLMARTMKCLPGSLLFRLAAVLSLGACVPPPRSPLAPMEMERLAPQPPVDAAAPQGRWRLVLVVPPGHPLSGTYSGTLRLAEHQGLLFGSVEDWSNGARSRFVGWHRGGVLHLARQDEAPWTGFRAAFDGVLSTEGDLMQGTCYNDASAPHGNNAVCTFTARRILDGPQIVDAE